MKTYLLALTLFLIPLNNIPAFALDSKPELQTAATVPEHIAAAQWATVEKLQKLLNEKNYQQAFMCFSEKIREKMKVFQHNDPNTMDYFFNQWTLTEKTAVMYKERVFSGKGLFIYDQNAQEWKINEI